MLFGREREYARIAESLDSAREGRSGALVVRGEAGIGKTALLNAAVERADGMRVLRALGVESEVDIAFSGLHELLRPALSSVGAVPDSQAVALRAALALGADAVTDRLAVFSGVLSLLPVCPFICEPSNPTTLPSEANNVAKSVALMLFHASNSRRYRSRTSAIASTSCGMARR